MHAKILNFLQRDRTYINVRTFMDGSDGYSMDDLSQHFNVGILESERENAIIVQSNGNIVVKTQRAYDSSKLLNDLCEFNGEQFFLPTPATVVVDNDGPYAVRTGASDKLKIAIDGGAPVTVTLTQTATAAVVNGVAGPYAIVLNTNDKLSIAFDGGDPVDVTLTAGGARTAAQIATDINTAFGITVAYDQSGTVVLISNTIGPDSEIHILVPASHSANSTLGFVDNTDTHGDGEADADQVASDINDAVGDTVADSVGSKLRIKSNTTGSASEINVEAVSNDAYTLLGLAVADTVGTDGMRIV